MRLELRMKYCETVYRRYRNASKESKARILDELCQVCGYNRKYAIWKLNRLRDKEKAKTPSKRRRSRKYGHEVLLIVEEVWKKSGYPWSVRLKEILRLWLPWIKKHYQVTAEVEEKLLEISASTIDRHLKPLKNKLKRRIYGRTKPGTLLKHKIPVKTDHWDVEQPGYLETDLVSHSGESGYGEFMHSLNFTDILSQWVETQAVMGKGRGGILKAFDKISQRLPFRILGIDSDNVQNLSITISGITAKREKYNLLAHAPIKRMIMLILNKKTGPMCGSSWVGTGMTLLKRSSP